MILELRKRGILVEVAAFPSVKAAREVMLKSSGFIDLEQYINQPADEQSDSSNVDELESDTSDKCTGEVIETDFMPTNMPDKAISNCNYHH